MKYAAALIAVALAPPTLLAQSSPPRTQGGAQGAPIPIERTLLNLEDDWARALVRRDAATFRRIIAPEFVYTENDQLSNRDAVIRDATTGSDTVTWAGNEGMKVHVYGDAAVVTGVLIVRGRSKGAAFEHRYRFTDTWVRRGGQWQIVAAQDYLAPAK